MNFIKKIKNNIDDTIFKQKMHKAVKLDMNREFNKAFNIYNELLEKGEHLDEIYYEIGLILNFKGIMIKLRSICLNLWKLMIIMLMYGI